MWRITSCQVWFHRVYACCLSWRTLPTHITISVVNHPCAWSCLTKMTRRIVFQIGHCKGHQRNVFLSMRILLSVVHLAAQLEVHRHHHHHHLLLHHHHRRRLHLLRRHHHHQKSGTGHNPRQCLIILIHEWREIYDIWYIESIPPKD